MDDHEPRPPSPAPAVLPLTGDHGAQWRPVSPDLTTVRRVSATAVLVPPALATAVAAILLTPWLAVATGVLVIVWLWLMWLIPRQVAAISWVELPEELAIRRGRMWRSLVTIPYGRIQYVDISSGPYKRSKGLADITVNTASPASSGDIPGLPVDVAEELRVRLAAHGEAQRAGL
ncbi:PH domain-containing protein [Janibacter alittae]|uniref:PH domain-containing protein n=1 Tax=Janibacter alittae TaxID=3115209 RepID=A0ABZ2MDV4_9MICO